MMSAGDHPGMTASVAVSSATSGESDDPNAGDGSEMKRIWKCIYVDLAFVKSLFGVFMAGELVLSFLGLISVYLPKNEGCAYLYSGTYAYYEFTSSSCFVVSFIWYILYALSVTKKCGCVPWAIAEIVWIGFFIFNYLICSTVIAAHACMQGGYKAAAAFGFLCMGVLCAHEFFELRNFSEKRKQSSAKQGQGAEETAKY